MNSMTRFQKRRWRLGPSTFRIFPLAIDLTPTRPLIGSRHTQHPDKANTSSCNPFSFDHFSIREPALDSQSLNQRLQPSSVPIPATESDEVERTALVCHHPNPEPGNNPPPLSHPADPQTPGRRPSRFSCNQLNNAHPPPAQAPSRGACI